MNHRRVWVEPSESVHPIDCASDRMDTVCGLCGCCDHCYHNCGCKECGCVDAVVDPPRLLVVEDES